MLGGDLGGGVTSDCPEKNEKETNVCLTGFEET
jgi:hypothetical protein